MLQSRSADSFDVVRVIAMLGVVADHFLQMTGKETLVNIGLFLGGVSVAMFFSLSAYLFGNKWRNSECKSFKPLPFLKKRFVRIFIPLWITLLFIIALEIYSQHQIDSKTITFNFLGLAWAKPFMWAGHLWYITMILILYVVFLVLSAIRLDKISVWLWILFIGITICIVICLPNMFNTVSRVLIPFTVLFASMLFTSGDKIMSFCNDHKFLICLMTFFVFSGTLYLYQDGALHSYKGFANILNSITGLMLFLAITLIFKFCKKSMIIKWISDISYEVYLIHLTAIMFIRILWLTPDCQPLTGGVNPRYQIPIHSCSIFVVLWLF